MKSHIEGLAVEAKKSISGASEEWGLDIGNNMAQIANAERIIPPTLEFAKRHRDDEEGEKFKAVKSGRGGDTAGEFDFRGRKFYKARSSQSSFSRYKKILYFNFLTSCKRQKHLIITSGPLSASAECKSVTLSPW